MLTSFLKSRRARLHRAITLVEVLLSIAIGVGIIITAVLLYYNAFGQGKKAEAFSQINSISSGIRNLYSAQSGYGTDDITEVAVQARIFENKWLEGDQPINPWGGDITIEGNGRTFTITYEGVPQEACAALIAQNSTGFGGAVKDVSVNGSSIGSQAIDPATATTACDEDNDNEIVWELR